MLVLNCLKINNIVTHADGSRVATVFGGICVFVCLSVCLFVCFCILLSQQELIRR